jgi:membrane protein YdbS with pleckstrin-like domain
MTIIKEKNLQKGEGVIYSPELHWIFLFKPMLVLLISIILFIIKPIITNYIFDVVQSSVHTTLFDDVYNVITIILFVFSILYLIWQIIKYYMVKYYITNKRLILKKGCFNSTLVDMPIEKIESIICHQSLLGRLLNYGTIYVSGIGGMLPRYGTIKKPYKVRRILYNMIDKNRNITIIREALPKPVLVRTVKERKAELEYGTFVTSYPAGEREVPIK